MSLRIRSILLVLSLSLAGCKSRFIEVTIVNQGPALHVMEFDYPSASFGLDKMAANADYGYGFQVRGSGPVKVQYTEAASQKIRQMTGPEIFERQEGQLEIVLLPDGKAEFHPQLTARP